MGIVTDIFLPLALAFIMFSLGLGLSGADFLRVIKQPKDFFVGAFSAISKAFSSNRRLSSLSGVEHPANAAMLIIAIVFFIIRFIVFIEVYD